MEAKCKKHPYYKAINPPKRSKHNPNGCPICWETYRTKKEAALQELAPKKKKRVKREAAPANKKVGEVVGQTLHYERDVLSGEYELFLGKRCLYVATNVDELDSFIVGFKEGVRYVSEREV